MNNLKQSQEAYTLLRQELEGKVAGCECSGGFNMKTKCIYLSEKTGCTREEEYSRCCPANCVEKCPICTEWRTLLKEWCWHVWSMEAQECFTCGQEFKQCINPDLTRHMTGSRLTLVVMMERVGLMSKFIKELIRAEIRKEFSIHLGYTNVIDILLDGEKLLPAVIAYLKERLG